MAKKKQKKSKIWPQKKCLEAMLAQRGTQANWVHANVHMTAHEVEAYFGPMCKDYEPLCSCCQAWVQWNQNGTVPVMMERDEVLKVLEIKVR
jgi:hypothetical protein